MGRHRINFMSRKKIFAGLKAAEEDRVVSYEEVKQRFLKTKNEN